MADQTNPFAPSKPTALAGLAGSQNLLGQPAGGFTQQAQDVFKAGTGKGTALAGPQKLTSLAEKQTGAATRQELTGVAQQRNLASNQFEQSKQILEQKQQDQQEDISVEEQNARDAYLQRGEEIMQEWRNSNTQLDTNKNKAQLEQMGFVLRLGDETYTNNLKREGRRSRLDSKVKFDEALRRNIFEEEQALFDNDLSFKSSLNQSERDFKKQMQEEGLSYSQALAISQMKSAQQAQVFTGATGIAQAGIAGAGQYAANERAEGQKYATYYGEEQRAGRTPMARDAWTTQQENLIEYGTPTAPTVPVSPSNTGLQSGSRQGGNSGSIV